MIIWSSENAVAATKPKRRAYLLKRKALTTGFFDQSRAKDADKDKGESYHCFKTFPMTQGLAFTLASVAIQRGNAA